MVTAVTVLKHDDFATGADGFQARAKRTPVSASRLLHQRTRRTQLNMALGKRDFYCLRERGLVILVEQL